MELEQVASGWAIARAGQELLESGGSPRRTLAGLGVLEQAARREPERDHRLDGRPGRPPGRSPGPSSILVRAQAAIAFALAQAIALVAPRRIVIGGGVSLIGEPNGSRRSADSSTGSSSRPSAAASTSCRPPSARKSSSTGPWPSPVMPRRTAC